MKNLVVTLIYLSLIFTNYAIGLELNCKKDYKIFEAESYKNCSIEDLDVNGSNEELVNLYLAYEEVENKSKALNFLNKGIERGDEVANFLKYKKLLNQEKYATDESLIYLYRSAKREFPPALLEMAIYNAEGAKVANYSLAMMYLKQAALSKRLNFNNEQFKATGHARLLLSKIYRDELWGQKKSKKKFEYWLGLQAAYLYKKAKK